MAGECPIVTCKPEEREVFTMQQEKMLQLLEQIELSNRRQTRFIKILCILTALVCVSSIVLFVCVASVLPRLNTVTQQMQSVLTNLETVSRGLASLDLEGMIRNVDSLVSDVDVLVGDVGNLVAAAQDSLRQTMDKLNTIDLETLNQAIQDLAAVIKPLADFFNLFNG